MNNKQKINPVIEKFTKMTPKYKGGALVQQPDKSNFFRKCVFSRNKIKKKNLYKGDQPPYKFGVI